MTSDISYLERRGLTKVQLQGLFGRNRVERFILWSKEYSKGKTVEGDPIYCYDEVLRFFLPERHYEVNHG